MTALTLRFRICPDGPVETQACLNAALEFLTTVDQLYYRRLPLGPCCPACAGVRYDEPGPDEHESPDDEYASVEAMVVRRLGRCGSIAAMTAARMRELDGDEGAYAWAEPVDLSKNVWHAVVYDGAGRRHDPTAKLISETKRKGEPDCGCEVI